MITADGTNKANYNGAMIYATDLEGKVTKINLTENFITDTDQIVLVTIQLYVLLHQIKIYNKQPYLLLKLLQPTEGIFIQDQKSQLTMITIYGYILELETLKSFKNSQVRYKIDFME